MKFFKNLNKGFTLLETLASVAVLSLVIIGPLAVTISSSGYARLTKDTIIATYLAEEAVELIQNQYDSMYIYCRKNASSTEVGGLCVPQAQETTTGQTAWRLFKDRFSAVDGQPSCYLPKYGGTSYPGHASGNPNGCAFDSVNLMASSTETLTRYNANETSCSYLVAVSTSTTQQVAGTGDQSQGGLISVSATSTTYVCGGALSHRVPGSLIDTKQFVRTVTIDQLPTFETVDANLQYNDDLRVTSNVQFKGINGISHSIKITRFMHARP